VSTLDNLRKEAKRWLKDVRQNNPGPRKRLRLAWPDAPADAGLRDIQHALARERGYESWKALKAALALRAAADAADAASDTSSNSAAHDTPAADRAGRVAAFLEFACWDHHVSGRGNYAMTGAAAISILAKDPDIARDSLYTAIVCGDVDEVERRLAADPSLVNEKGGSRGWEPILYLCYARLSLPAARDCALAIARALLDRGANPNAYYMAGGSVYSTLVGVAGEGEQDAPPHPQRERLYELLLERGAEPFDIQVLYNTHFHGDVRWWLELTYAHTVKIGRKADWDHADWPMLDMGGYGSGARFLLWTAIEHDDVGLAEWLLAHGANPDAAPARDARFSKRSLYEDARRRGNAAIAELLLRYGATPRTVVLDDEEAFLDACLRLDRREAEALVAKHPEYLPSTTAIFEAARRNRADAVALLLDLGVPIEVEDAFRKRTLHVAASGAGAPDVVTLLLARGAEIDPRETHWGATPIGYASHHDNQPMIDLLAPVSRVVWALAAQGRVARLREVLDAEPERAKEVTANGLTLLWRLPGDDARAADVVKLLLAHGADPSRKAKDGTTAADAARKRGLDAAADLIAAAGADATGAEAGAETVADADATANAGATATATATTAATATVMTVEQYDSLANDLAVAYETGDAAALARLHAHYRHTFTWEDLRAEVWRRVRTVREAKGAARAFGIAETRDLVARNAGFAGWDALVKALGTGAPASGRPYAIDAKAGRITPRRPLAADEWDTLIAVMKERRITSLDANGQMTDDLLARVAELDHVTHLALGGSRQLTDDGLQHLARMPQLQALDLSEYPGGKLTDRGLDVLRHLPELRSFEMTWQSAISDAGVANLRFCDRLERVNLLGTPTGDGAIDALRGKPNLRRLSTGRLVTDAALPWLHEFPCFETWQGGDISYGLMGAEAGPTHLLLDGPFTNRGLAALAGLGGLFALTFFWHVSALTSDGLALLADLPRLGFLGCQDALCDDVAMRHIGAAPGLRMLMEQGAVASDDGFEALARSGSIEYIWGRDCPNLTGRGFAALSRMPALRGLAVSCKQVDRDALALLPRFPALRQLVPMQVQDDGFEHVGRCARLEALSCMYCRDTTDRATEQIAGLSALQTYYAGATQITDRSLEVLGGMPSLERVELYECTGVTDAGLPFLARLPRLREVALSGLPHVTLDGTAVFPDRVKVDYWP
jgi:ankyrin repeat protein